MKFKSTIVDIPTFTKIAQSLALLSKQAWLRLTPGKVQFIIQPSRTQVYAEIEKESMFTAYLIESNADNIINLELNVDNLGRLLRNLSDTGQVSMKLTKRDKYPMLSFSTQYFGKQGGSNTVTHDLHVRVLSSAFIAQVSEPIMPEPDVTVFLPALSHLLQISTSLRSLSDKLVIRGNMSGEFSLGIRTPAVSTSTVFQGLLNPLITTDDGQQVQVDGGSPEQGSDKAHFCTLKVDAKDWCNLLRIGSVAKRAVACFCEGHALVLYVYLSEEEDVHSSVITYYIATFQE